MLCITEGWPKVCQDVDLQKYHQVREYLSVDQGCLVFGFRVVIPESLRDRMLEELHETHCGVVKLLLLTRIPHCGSFETMAMGRASDAGGAC